MADNKKISDLVADNSLISYDGFVGWVDAGGGINQNKRISGKYIRYGAINSNDSAGDGRLAFYGPTTPIDPSAPNGPKDTSLGGSASLTFASDTLTVGNTTFGGAIDVVGNYFAGNDQPKITFKGGFADNTAPNAFDFIITTDKDSVDQTWVLPSTLPTAGQVLQADNVLSNDVDLKWTTPSGGVDFSSIVISGPGNIKADLTQSTQAQYGQAVTVKASSAIDNGAVVIWDYSGSEVQAKMPSGSTPDQHEIIGVAIEDIDSGSKGKVLVYGYVTAKFVPVAGNVVQQVLLDGSANINGGTTIVSDVNNSTSFQDEGGTGSSYSANSNYTHTFYNNGGNISMEFVDWSIEQGTGSDQLWDRLGFTVSNDGTTFQNAEFTPHVTGSSGGWRRSTNSIAPWSEDEAQGSFPNGYILAESPGTTFPAGSVIDTGYKYVRAYFRDDGSAQQAGWEINVYGTESLSSSSVVAGESAFINPNDLTATSGSGATGRRIGNYVGTDISNNAVVIFIAPARPQA